MLQAACRDCRLLCKQLLFTSACRCRNTEARHAGAEAGVPDAAGCCLVETASDQLAAPGKPHVIDLGPTLMSIHGSLCSTWSVGSSTDTSRALQLVAACKFMQVYVLAKQSSFVRLMHNADLRCTGSIVRLPSSVSPCCD